MRHTHLYGFAIAMSLTLAASAHAQDDGTGFDFTSPPQQTPAATSSSPGWDYPKAYSARPLTMQAHMLRGTFRISVKKIGLTIATPLGTFGVNDTLVSLDFGAAFAVLDDLEVGISSYRLGSTSPRAGQGLLPIVVSPSGEFGDIPMWVRYRFYNEGKIQMAADLVLVLPSGSEFAMTAGLPVRIKTRDSLTIDTGGELTLATNNTGLNFEVPVKVTFNITDEGFIFGSGGLAIESLGGQSASSVSAFPVDKNQIFIPLSLGGGYTLAVKDKVMIDFIGEFGWKPFLYLNPPGGVNAVPAGDTWFLGIGMNVYTKPLFD